jgi:hypothetical protein
MHPSIHRYVLLTSPIGSFGTPSLAIPTGSPTAPATQPRFSWPKRTHVSHRFQTAGFSFQRLTAYRFVSLTRESPRDPPTRPLPLCLLPLAARAERGSSALIPQPVGRRAASRRRTTTAQGRNRANVHRILGTCERSLYITRDRVDLLMSPSCQDEINLQVFPYQPFPYRRVGERRRGYRFWVANLVYVRTRPQSQRTIPGFHSPLIKPYVRFSLIRLSCEKSETDNYVS